MRVEVINTGTELLLGSTLNTHLVYLGEQLFPFGLRIQRQECIPDGDVIREALLESFRRADIVIVTGGLGPTSDDITREISAELLGRAMQEDAEVYARISDYLGKRNREMNAHTRRQTQVPIGATVLHNDFGTAPGLYFPPRAVLAAPGLTSPHLFLLPGPPRELKPMFVNKMAPLLRQICEGKIQPALMANYRLCCIGESQVSQDAEPSLRSLGEDLEIGYCARPGEVIVRCLGTAAQLEAARMIVAAAFPQHFFSDDDSNLEQTLVTLLTKLGRTVATAESCTGGMIADRITNVPGASAVLMRGYVTYANEAKSDLLGVDAALLREKGAVSKEVCRAMVEGCLARAGTDYAIATTGIAGPGGGSDEKPVGTVYIGVAGGGKESVVERHFFPFDREMFKQMAAQWGLDMVRRRVLGML